MRRVYLFLSAFQVLPQKEYTIQDHFFYPLLPQISHKSLISYSIFQGPFLRQGFKQQFQCYLHCLALRNTFSGMGLILQSLSEMIFQLRELAFTDGMDNCYSTIILSISASYSAHDLTDRLTFLIPSHLNMQLAAVTPGIRVAIFFQSQCVISWSRSVRQCLSAYLETVQTRILRSSSLQFFLIFRFLSILSIREDTILKMVSSLMQLGITFFTRFNCPQCARTSGLNSLFLCQRRFCENVIKFFLASKSWSLLAVPSSSSSSSQGIIISMESTSWGMSHMGKSLQTGGSVSKSILTNYIDMLYKEVIS